MTIQLELDEDPQKKSANALEKISEVNIPKKINDTPSIFEDDPKPL